MTEWLFCGVSWGMENGLVDNGIVIGTVISLSLSLSFCFLLYVLSRILWFQA